jgi:hypothetical protein
MVQNSDDLGPLLDVQFLLESGQIEAEDAALILSKVPGLANGGGAVITDTPPSSKHSMGRSRSNTAVLAADVDGLQMAPPSYPSLENVMNNVPRSQQQQQQAPAPKRQARALWDYNLDGEVSFFTFIPIAPNHRPFGFDPQSVANAWYPPPLCGIDPTRKSKISRSKRVLSLKY